MKTLHLLRHAKSDWGTSAVDHDRPLNARGDKARHVIAAHVTDWPIDLVVSSTAIRARLTAEPVATMVGCPLETSKAIYDARAEDLLRAVQELPDSAETVLLVGHNPGMEEIAWLLTGEPCTFTTAALGTVSLDVGSWLDCRPRCGHLIELVNAKTLTGSG